MKQKALDQKIIAKQLEEKLATLTLRLDRITSEVRQSHSGDSAEQAQERENDEVVDAIGNETRVTIHNIQAALQRIEDGNYGVCESCGENISPSRLGILPESTQCVECAP